MRRAVDLVVSSVALVVLAPGLLIMALVLRIRSGRPVLFLQDRSGLDGRVFRIVKFRTMRAPEFPGEPDAARLGALGWALRVTSLDELPQLWNVLRGEMSLIGPRPAPPREVDGYDVWHRRRLSMKPGISGLWQVEARLDEHFDERATLDLNYIDQWSLALDFKILVRTIPAVLARPGR